MDTRAFCLTLAISVVLASCSTKKEVEPALFHKGSEQQTRKSPSALPVQEGVDAIKGEVLKGYPAPTIGSAFDSYKHFEKSQWKEIKTGNGKSYVDFTGWIKTATVDVGSIKKGAGVKGLEVKFVIYPDATFDIAMISKVDVGTDGMTTATPLKDAKSILERIYTNKELAL